MFYLPFSTFRQAYSDFSITMFDNKWQRNRRSGSGKPGKEEEFLFTNPVDQEVIITFENTFPRMVPTGCTKRKTNYNLYLKPVGGKDIVGP